MAYVIKDPIELMMREAFEDWESSNELNTGMGDTKESYKAELRYHRDAYGYDSYFGWRTSKHWKLFQHAFLSGAQWAQNSNALENSKKEDGSSVT